MFNDKVKKTYYTSQRLARCISKEESKVKIMYHIWEMMCARAYNRLHVLLHLLTTNGDRRYMGVCVSSSFTTLTIIITPDIYIIIPSI